MVRKRGLSTKVQDVKDKWREATETRSALSGKGAVSSLEVMTDTI